MSDWIWRHWSLNWLVKHDFKLNVQITLQLPMYFITKIYYHNFRMNYLIYKTLFIKKDKRFIYKKYWNAQLSKSIVSMEKFLTLYFQILCSYKIINKCWTGDNLWTFVRHASISDRLPWLLDFHKPKTHETQSECWPWYFLDHCKQNYCIIQKIQINCSFAIFNSF